MTGTLAIAPLTDFSTWLRGHGLEIVLIVLGALLLARFVSWCGRRITERMDVASTDVDAVVRSEAAKHRRAVAQILTLLTIGVIWSVAGVLIRPGCSEFTRTPCGASSMATDLVRPVSPHLEAT